MPWAVLWVVWLALLAGLAPTPTPPGHLVVFAASSLSEAFGEVGQVLGQDHPGLRVTFQFAASSLLRTQILQGARADVFASADERNMQLVREAGLLGTPPVTFCRNELVVVVPAHNPARVSSVRDLARPGVKLVAASPEVPLGAYTRQVLSRLSREASYGADFGQRVLHNVRSYEPNVRMLLARVALGEADAAFVYRSDVLSGYGRRVRTVEIPRWAKVVATYPMAVLRGAPNPEGARRFVEFVLSASGQQILARWGFLPARE